MRICIYGAGAIGGFIGARLALAEVDVTLIARGPHLAAMQKNGLKIISGDEELLVHPRFTSDPSEVGPQDYVIVTLKAPSVPGIVDSMLPLFDSNTAVVTAVNGIPWWYFYGLPGPFENHQLKCVDPDARQWNGIGPARAIGCVVYPACEIVEPGVIRYVEGERLSLGEPSGEKTDRCTKLSQVLIDAGFKAPVRPQIRNDIWIKLWGNLSFNPLSALTHATLDVIATEPGTRAIARAMMVEAQAVGEKLGVRFAVDVDRRIDGAAAVGAHKTSMLQDLERGRPMEIDALVTVVQELARLVEIDTPTIDSVLAMVQQRARTAGLA
ncbi:MAG: 2-dehydropantoate 2-reductase [Gammaproteobacteria bacterium]|nr:2-dehydropantoate 2-reductase [Gammaproteobacteria bacterium]